MTRLIDLTGEKFGRLTVICKAERPSHIITKSTYWLCKCDCGNETVVLASSLKGGKSKSCGCYNLEKIKQRNTKHGLRNTVLYNSWRAMKERCYNKNFKQYKDYGGRGISVCGEWLNKENGFTNFYNWAIANNYKDGLSIDRIDVNGNYDPSNCRWATRKEQNNNARRNHLIEYNGETHTVAEWAEIKNLTKAALYHRLQRGWSIKKALETAGR